MDEKGYKIGVNIGKADKYDRGITVYTRKLLDELGSADGTNTYILLHYPEKSPDRALQTNKSTFAALPFTDKHAPVETIIFEQVVGPISQALLGLDVIWHPHNRCQIFTPVPYVCTMHDVLAVSRPDLTNQYLSAPDKKLLYQTRTYTARFADAIITPSEFERQEIIKHLGVAPDKITKIPYGLDHEIFRPNLDTSQWRRIKEKYEIPDKYLLSVGSYAPHKNLNTLIDAFCISRLPGLGYDLVIMGPNDATGYKKGFLLLQEYVVKRKMTNHVKMMHSAPHLDLSSIYSHASIYASTSEYESFGFTPVEAMACGTPTVVSKAAAMPEICGNGALYSEPHNPQGFANYFNLLINDEQARQQLIAAGLSQVLKYNWSQAATETSAVLRSVANRSL